MERPLDEWIEAIEEKLDEDRPEDALRLAEKGVREYPESADLLALGGDALWALGEVRGASDAYEKAVALVPDGADLLAGLARIRFSLCDFFGARRHAKDALRLEERPEAVDVLSRLAERSGRMEEADRLAARAHRIDSFYSIPHRIPEEEFRQVVEEAVDALPDRFRDAVRNKNVAILVEAIPAEAILLEEDPPFDPAILGLYRGIPLPERTSDSQREPDTIHLFRHNLERVAGSRQELLREIAITVYHELGHFFGFDEEELEELDLD